MPCSALCLFYSSLSYRPLCPALLHVPRSILPFALSCSAPCPAMSDALCIVPRFSALPGPAPAPALPCLALSLPCPATPCLVLTPAPVPAPASVPPSPPCSALWSALHQVLPRCRVLRPALSFALLSILSCAMPLALPRCLHAVPTVFVISSLPLICSDFFLLSFSHAATLTSACLPRRPALGYVPALSFFSLLTSVLPLPSPVLQHAPTRPAVPFFPLPLSALWLALHYCLPPEFPSPCLSCPTCVSALCVTMFCLVLFFAQHSSNPSSMRFFPALPTMSRPPPYLQLTLLCPLPALAMPSDLIPYCPSFHRALSSSSCLAPCSPSCPVFHPSPNALSQRCPLS